MNDLLLERIKELSGLPITEGAVSLLKIGELEKVFPQMAAAYKEIFGTKKPDIKVNTATDYTFNTSAFKGARKVHVLYRDGQTKILRGSWGGPNPFSKPKEQELADSQSTVELKPGDMAMECAEGSYTSCTLYVHPDNITKLLPDKTEGELNPLERATLLIIRGLIPKVRKEYFAKVVRQEPYGTMDYISDENKANIKELIRSTYPEAKKIGDLWDKVTQDLERLGYVKINKIGSVSLSDKGKNFVFKIKGY